MARLRSNNVFGTTTNNPLAAADTTLNSAGLANLTAVTGTDVAVITLDPNRVHGAPEIVHVTAHTGGASSATILRGQEGTAAREHPSGTFWAHGWTALDAGLGVLGRALKTTSQTGITTEVDLSGLSVAVTVGTGRLILVSCFVPHDRSVADGISRVKIMEGGTQLQICDGFVRAAAEGVVPLQGSVLLTPSAGAHTYKLTMLRASGTGTVAAQVGATFPAHILVEDIGAA